MGKFYKKIRSENSLSTNFRQSVCVRQKYVHFIALNTLEIDVKIENKIFLSV